GGLTGLGLLTARHLVKRGARHLVLMGRRNASESAQQIIAWMEEAGAQVVIQYGNVSKLSDVQRVLQQIEENMPPLRGIIHSAGVLDDGVLLQQNWDKFARVLSPKVDGAWHLHSLTKDMPLDFMVLFSSTAAIFGSAGQANHAAANTFLDMLAHYRRAQGLPALSLNWGIWSEVGIAAEKNVGERMKQQGVGTIFPEQGLQILDSMIDQDVAQVIVTPIHWHTFLNTYANGSKPAWLYGMEREAEQRTSTLPVATQPEKSSPALMQRLAEAPSNQKLEILLAFVTEQVTKVLGLSSSDTVDPRQPLQELGLDSLTAVELRNLLSNTLKPERSLPATLVFDYPTINALADFLAHDILKLDTKKTEKKSIQTDDVDLLKDIESLSDEEVTKMLSNLQG
ncbi:MAG TPA: beta-ketoacyl reductase, partial [Anaerolineales bacterium]|nr:beta-ketoacyl reductase [Anaerolineales bacterium]